MNAAQILPLAAAAGFTGADLATAVAIALAESSGNPQAYNPEPAAGTPTGMGSYGLWQIYLAAHPEFTGLNLYDPQTNAQAAFDVYSHHGFSQWTTYRNGRYQQYLAAVLAAQPQPAPLPANAGAGAIWSPPLTIDAATGLPVSDAVPADQAAAYASIVDTSQGLSMSKVLLWAGLGLFALWIFEEAA